MCQFVSQFDADQIRPRAEHLAKLDECSPQIGQGQPHAYGKRLIGEHFAGMAGEHPPGRFPFGPLEPRRQAVRDEHARHLLRSGDFTGNLGGGL